MISLDDIRSLANLARLKLTGTEEENLQKDISNILEYVGQVSDVSAAQGSTLDQGSSRSNLSQPHNVMREDVPYVGAMVLGKREVLLKAFPQREGDFDVVRQIIEKEA